MGGLPVAPVNVGEDVGYVSPNSFNYPHPNDVNAINVPSYLDDIANMLNDDTNSSTSLGFSPLAPLNGGPGQSGMDPEAGTIIVLDLGRKIFPARFRLKTKNVSPGGSIICEIFLYSKNPMSPYTTSDTITRFKSLFFSTSQGNFVNPNDQYLNFNHDHVRFKNSILNPTPMGGFQSAAVGTLANTSFGSNPFLGGVSMIDKVQFMGFRFVADQNIFPTNGVEIESLEIYEEVDPRDFNLEFDDALLDQAGWKNIRFEGSKLIGKEINKYSLGDTTLGKNPVVENKTTALYIANTVIAADGSEDDRFATVLNHSYIGINKILIVDEEDDSVQILDKEAEEFEQFHRFVTSDFPAGSPLRIKCVDESIQNNLKTGYFCKMNKGFLLSTFKYFKYRAPQFTMQALFSGDAIDI